MKLNEEKCKSCIWMDDETGKCEGDLSNHGHIQLSPFYKAHPEITPQLGPGLEDEDCVGMEHRPRIEGDADAD